MSESREEGKDESSIKPVSSLRSRFENLNNAAASGSPVSPSPVLPSKPAFLRELQTTQTGNERSVGRIYGTESDAGVGAQAATQTGHQDEPMLRRRGPSSPRSRPHSMIAMSPTQLSGPMVTVNPPSSPAKYGSNLPSTPHARTLSRVAATPTEARPPPFLGPLNGHRASSDGTVTAPTSPEIRPKSAMANGPPPINRAGKPTIPKKPPTLAPKPTSLSAPQNSARTASERSVSPFNTPPSSTGSSPAPIEQAIPPRIREHSGSAAGSRTRGESDASFVEQIRSNSNDSSPDRARGQAGQVLPPSRIRAQSNTSIVEPSSLPETHYHWNQPPPSHHTATTRREQLAHGKPLPSRYRTMTASEVESDDLPDQRPRLPARPELQSRSGRNSPTRRPAGRVSPVNDINLHRSAAFDAQAPQQTPTSKSGQRSALSLGFSSDPSARTRVDDEARVSRDAPVSTQNTPSQPVSRSPASTLTATKLPPPSVPAPRRSADKRREGAPPIPIINTTDGHSRDDEEDPSRFEKSNGTFGADAPPPAALTDYPDSSQASRRPPSYRQRPHYIYTEAEARTFAVCGQYVCTTGHQTKAWNLRTGELLLNMVHNETIRGTALVFKPCARVEDEGKRIWLGTNAGEIHEVDIPSQSLVKTKANAHPRREIIRMYRYASELWTLDDGGDLNVWKPDRDSGSLSLDSQCNNFRMPRGHTFSIALGSRLWYATGREIRVFAPGARSDAEFQVLRSPLSQQGASEICSGSTLSGKPDLVYFGHSDGKVSIYNRHDFSCTGVVNVSMYKLNSLVGVGDYLWAGFHTGMVFVYDTSTTPWRVKKDWKAHDKYVWSMAVDRSAVWKFDRLQVVTLGVDNLLKIWDGTLEEDWLDSRMKEHDSQYCSFRELTASVLTWNAGATKPHYLQQDPDEQDFLREYMTTRNFPDVFVFGLQELIDLENKKASAKSFFKSITKDPNEPEHIGHQYRAWRDYLTRCLDEYMPANQTYTLLHTSSLVGLFTCIFVKTPLRARIKHVHAAEVKRGMGGHHGNKGALVVRMVLDDSSVCFINCHLAAGQTQTKDRNHDIAEILEAGNLLPADPLSSSSSYSSSGKDGAAQHSDVFASGGDGSMILDHEICILSGDLNYRIDTMGRDTVIKLISQGQLPRLLERDQLLLSRKKNAGNRLRAFQESEIRFPPTYKYDPRSDRYDTSEKRRAPAWCDRILYRGSGKVKMEEYRRWELRISDHRPVSGLLRLRVKRVDGEKRAQVWEMVKGEFETVRQRICREVQIEYLTLVLGLSPKEAAAALTG